MLIDLRRNVKNRHPKNVNDNVCDSLSAKVIHFDISVQFIVKLGTRYINFATFYISIESRIISYNCYYAVMLTSFGQIVDIDIAITIRPSVSRGILDKQRYRYQRRRSICNLDANECNFKLIVF